ncbi:MAG: hypothetical protein V3V13_04460 [Paracoccaceae bacterium]
MSGKTQNTVPQPFHDFVHQTQRYAKGMQRLSFNDDSDIGVGASAAQLTSLMEGAIEYIAIPSSKNEPVKLDEIAERIAPSVNTFGDMITVLRADAAAGFTSLPDMDDAQIGNNIMGMELAAQYRLLELMTTVNVQKASPERSELLECLDGIGVPVATVGLQIPVLVKLFIALIIIIVANIFPGFKPIATKILLALAKMDRRGQGGDGARGGDTGTAKLPCGGSVILTRTGIGKTVSDAEDYAESKAKTDAAKNSCPTACPPVRVLKDNIKISGGNGLPFVVDVIFGFKCT